MEPNQRDALAAKHFPKQWANVATKPGASKKRQQLRQAGERAEVCAALREKGARCATCANYTHAHGLQGNKRACALDSDFHGYAIVQADGLCWRWKGGGA